MNLAFHFSGKDVIKIFLKCLFVAYLVIICGLSLLSITSGQRFEDISKVPCEIYDEGDLNLLGSIAMFLFLLIINPLPYLVRLIYWVFHVGRR